MGFFPTLIGVGGAGSRRRRGGAVLRSSKGRRTKKKAQSIDNLPDPLLLEILCKLPDSQSVVRCKAVSKRWFSLISDSHFIHRHRQFDDLCFNFLIQLFNKCDYVMQPSIPKFETSDSNQHHLFKLVPCFRVQDTLPPCVVAYFRDLVVLTESLCYHRDYYIYNILTKQWLMLPPAPSRQRWTPVGFVCYPAYCRSTEQACTTNARYSYTVVRIIIPTDGLCKFNVDIFSSNKSEWTNWEVSSPSSLHTLRGLSAVVTFNGILHWVNPNLNIIAYDPLNNVKQCRIIDPPTDFIHDMEHCLRVCRGSIRISRITSPPHSHGIFTVWELEDYNSGKWQLVHSIDLYDMVSDDDWLADPLTRFLYMRILAFHPFDVDIIFLHFRGQLVSYNMSTRMLKLVHKLKWVADPYYYEQWLQLFPIVHPWWPTPVPPLPEDALPC